MKIRILVLAIVLCSISCKNSDKVERENQPAIYNVESDDRETTEAIKKANQTLTNFNSALLDPTIEIKSLKVRFDTPNGNQHIWTSNVEYKNGKYSGILDNLPEYVTENKIGDKIDIDNTKISDWMYIENGKLIGGFTIKLLRNRMTVGERKQFDAESSMQID